MAKEIVHCVEITPGSYLVSAKFMAEIEKQAQKTTWKGSIFGVEIRESKHLPMIIEKAEESLNGADDRRNGLNHSRRPL